MFRTVLIAQEWNIMYWLKKHYCWKRGTLEISLFDIGEKIFWMDSNFVLMVNDVRNNGLSILGAHPTM